MMLFYLLAAIVCIAIGVVAFLFYMLNKESAKEEDAKAVPIAPQEAVEPLGSANESEYKKKIEELEGELTALSERGLSQSQEALSLIEKLTKENEMLRAEREGVQSQDEQLAKAAKEVDQLRGDNHLLQTQLESMHDKVEQLQQEAIALRQRLDDETTRANYTIENLRCERDSLAGRKDAASDSLAREVENLHLQVEALEQETSDLRLNNAKLKELNNTLIEKSQALQYELSKNRAQVSGLERICENYKVQLEKRI